MDKVIVYLKTLPPVYSFAVGVPLIFAFLWMKSKPFQTFILGFFPRNKEKRMIRVLDLVLQEGFESFHKMNALEFTDLRNKRRQVIEETSLSLYMKVCRAFDDEIGFESSETTAFSVANERKFFENSARMLLNLCSQKVALYFEERGVRDLSEADFRSWADSKLGILKNDIEREFYNSYPDIGLNVPRGSVEALVSSMRSEIRDLFFEAAFNVRDLEKAILKEINEEKQRFNEKKTRLFADFLGN